MAPEQFVTGQSSVQSDVWALGVILYELASVGAILLRGPTMRIFRRFAQFSSQSRRT